MPFLEDVRRAIRVMKLERSLITALMER